jgi:hypothetical protein
LTEFWRLTLPLSSNIVFLFFLQQLCPCFWPSPNFLPETFKLLCEKIVQLWLKTADKGLMLYVWVLLWMISCPSLMQSQKSALLWAELYWFPFGYFSATVRLSHCTHCTLHATAMDSSVLTYLRK